MEKAAGKIESWAKKNKIKLNPKSQQNQKLVLLQIVRKTEIKGWV